MKFKLDENLPVELVTDLRGLGHDADTVTGEGLRGAADPAVVEAALAADRILFTLDKGIANLQRYPIRQYAGVVLSRRAAGSAKSFVTTGMGLTVIQKRLAYPYRREQCNSRLWMSLFYV